MPVGWGRVPGPCRSYHLPRPHVAAAVPQVTHSGQEGTGAQASTQHPHVPRLTSTGGLMSARGPACSPHARPQAAPRRVALLPSYPAASPCHVTSGPSQGPLRHVVARLRSTEIGHSVTFMHKPASGFLESPGTAPGSGPAPRSGPAHGRLPGLRVQLALTSSFSSAFVSFLLFKFHHLRPSVRL